MEYSERNEIVIVDKNEQVRSENYGFPFYRKGAVYGLTAGLIMSAVALIIGLLAGPESLGWDFLKYLVLGFVLGRLLSLYKAYLPSGKVFKDGILLGLYTAFVAALTMAAVNLIVGLAGMETGILQKFGLEAATFGEALALNGLLIFECLVFGLILTFVWLQLLKDPRPAE